MSRLNRSALRRLAACAALSAALLIGACAGLPKSERPLPLMPIVNRFPVTTVWSTGLGGQAPALELGLDMAVDGNRVFLASYHGTVEALALATGRVLWRHAVHEALAGGPGAGNGLVVVGGSKGWVIALSERDGTQRWRVRLNTEILATPAVGPSIVLVRGVDGRLYGLDPANGRQSWVADQQVPTLSLRGTSSPILDGDLAICGFDNGHVMAVSRSTGAVAWDQVIAEATGSSQLQRLIDVDAPVVAAGRDVYAVAYQGRLVRMLRQSGQIVWSHELSSYRGLTVRGNAVFVSTSGGMVMRLARSTGAVLWTQKGLLRRQLTAPVLYRGRVVVADLQGFVHWLDPNTGTIVARESVGSRVTGPLMVAGGLLLVRSDAGRLVAFRTPSAGVTLGSVPVPAARTDAHP